MGHGSEHVFSVMLKYLLFLWLCRRVESYKQGKMQENSFTAFMHWINGILTSAVRLQLMKERSAFQPSTERAVSFQFTISDIIQL